MYANARFQSLGTTSNSGTKFAQNYMDDKMFAKINIKILTIIQQSTPPIWRNKFAQKTWVTKFLDKHENCNKHIAMYPCSKFQLIWGTSDFGIKFAQETWMTKTLKK